MTTDPGTVTTTSRDWSGLFWGAMLPVSWTLAGVLTILAHAQIRRAEVVELGTLFHSTVFMAVFLAMFGLIAVRILIARAMDHDHPRQAQAIGAVCAIVSVSLIAYGVSRLV